MVKYIGTTHEIYDKPPEIGLREPVFYSIYEKPYSNLSEKPKPKGIIDRIATKMYVPKEVRNLKYRGHIDRFAGFIDNPKEGFGILLQNTAIVLDVSEKDELYAGQYELFVRRAREMFPKYWKVIVIGKDDIKSYLESIELPEFCEFIDKLDHFM
jgi:hypothetical protein